MNLEMSSPAADARGQAKGLGCPAGHGPGTRGHPAARGLPSQLGVPLAPPRSAVPGTAPSSGQLAGQRGRREGEAAARAEAKEGREGEEGGAATPDTERSFLVAPVSGQPPGPPT